jgi:hypothetical protein
LLKPSAAPARRRFFVRVAVFSRTSSLRWARRPSGASHACHAAMGGLRAYAIDGNVYREAGGATIQLGTRPDTDDSRDQAVPPLDERMDRLLDDPRLVGRCAI